MKNAISYLSLIACIALHANYAQASQPEYNKCNLKLFTAFQENDIRAIESCLIHDSLRNLSVPSHKNGNNILHAIVKKKHFKDFSEHDSKKLLETAIDFNIDISAKNHYNFSPLMLAYKYNDEESISLLKKAGAKITNKEKTFATKNSKVKQSNKLTPKNLVRNQQNLAHYKSNLIYELFVQLDTSNLQMDTHNLLHAQSSRDHLKDISTMYTNSMHPSSGLNLTHPSKTDSE